MSQNKDPDSDVDIYGDLPNFNSENAVSELETAKNNLENELKALKIKLEHIETQNNKLKKDNEALSTNISSLYKTATSEIKRKDKMIQELQKEKDSILFRRRRNEPKSYSYSHDSNADEVLFLGDFQSAAEEDVYVIKENRQLHNISLLQDKQCCLNNESEVNASFAQAVEDDCIIEETPIEVPSTIFSRRKAQQLKLSSKKSQNLSDTTKVDVTYSVSEESEIIQENVNNIYIKNQINFDRKRQELKSCNEPYSHSKNVFEIQATKSSTVEDYTLGIKEMAKNSSAETTNTSFSNRKIELDVKNKDSNSSRSTVEISSLKTGIPTALSKTKHFPRIEDSENSKYKSYQKMKQHSDVKKVKTKASSKSSFYVANKDRDRRSSADLYSHRSPSDNRSKHQTHSSSHRSSKKNSLSPRPFKSRSARGSSVSRALKSLRSRPHIKESRSQTSKSTARDPREKDRDKRKKVEREDSKKKELLECKKKELHTAVQLNVSSMPLKKLLTENAQLKNMHLPEVNSTMEDKPLKSKTNPKTAENISIIKKCTGSNLKGSQNVYQDSYCKNVSEDGIQNELIQMGLDRSGDKVQENIPAENEDPTDSKRTAGHSREKEQDKQKAVEREDSKIKELSEWKKKELHVQLNISVTTENTSMPLKLSTENAQLKNMHLPEVNSTMEDKPLKSKTNLKTAENISIIKKCTGSNLKGSQNVYQDSYCKNVSKDGIQNEFIQMGLDRSDEKLQENISTENEVLSDKVSATEHCLNSTPLCTENGTNITDVSLNPLDNMNINTVQEAFNVDTQNCASIGVVDDSKESNMDENNFPASVVTTNMPDKSDLPEENILLISSQEESTLHNASHFKISDNTSKVESSREYSMSIEENAVEAGNVEMPIDATTNDQKVLNTEVDETNRITNTLLDKNVVSSAQTTFLDAEEKDNMNSYHLNTLNKPSLPERTTEYLDDDKCTTSLLQEPVIEPPSAEKVTDNANESFSPSTTIKTGNFSFAAVNERGCFKRKKLKRISNENSNRTSTSSVIKFSSEHLNTEKHGMKRPNESMETKGIEFPPVKRQALGDLTKDYSHLSAIRDRAEEDTSQKELFKNTSYKNNIPSDNSSSLISEPKLSDTKGKILDLEEGEIEKSDSDGEDSKVLNNEPHTGKCMTYKNENVSTVRKEQTRKYLDLNRKPKENRRKPHSSHSKELARGNHDKHHLPKKVFGHCKRRSPSELLVKDRSVKGSAKEKGKSSKSRSTSRSHETARRANEFNKKERLKDKFKESHRSKENKEGNKSKFVEAEREETKDCVDAVLQNMHINKQNTADLIKNHNNDNNDAPSTQKENITAHSESQSTNKNEDSFKISIVSSNKSTPVSKYVIKRKKVCSFQDKVSIPVVNISPPKMVMMAKSKNIHENIAHSNSKSNNSISASEASKQTNNMDFISAKTQFFSSDGKEAYTSNSRHRIQQTELEKRCNKLSSETKNFGYKTALDLKVSEEIVNQSRQSKTSSSLMMRYHKTVDFYKQSCDSSATSSSSSEPDHNSDETWNPKGRRRKKVRKNPKTEITKTKLNEAR